ncbi:MAG: hypothetical protein NVSMB54_37390 [Ktedonobacteraceae bacterium]
MVKATKAIQSDIVLIVRALVGKGDLMAVLNEITKSLEDCRMNSRKTAPNAYQLMTPPSPPAQNGSKGSG